MNVKATLRTAEQGMKLMELNEKMGQDESMPTFSYHLDWLSILADIEIKKS